MSQRETIFRISQAVALTARCGIGVSVLACCAHSQPAVASAHGPSPAASWQASADVLSPPPGAIKTRSGIEMEVLQAGSGLEHPTGDDCAVVRFTARKRDGSLYAASGPHGESTTQCLTSAIPGISEVLQLMVVGEKRRVWLPALPIPPHPGHHDKNLHEDRPPQPELVVDLELITIRKAPVPPGHLREPPSTAFRSESGVALQVMKPGTGTEHPDMSSRVTLNFSGWTSDGKLFETTVTSGHPASFLVGATLPGWREVLPRMVVGEKARIWVPAALGYGEHPADKLAPAGNLVYEIELLDVQK